jgi:Ca-activated chloride channel homolog
MKHSVTNTIVIVLLIGAFAAVSIVSCTGCLGRARMAARHAGPYSMIGRDALAEARPGVAISGATEGEIAFAYQPGEELWIIGRVTAPEVDSNVDTGPGCGSLVCNQIGEDDRVTQVPMPLKHTDVQAAIDGYIATVRVTQQYHNPFDGTIEAVYVFPLPQNAAINEFLMTVGDRTIRGIIRERQEAEEIYAEAKRQGHTASLMTQERANIFTQKVANIDPGQDIDIDIQYFNTLAYHDGAYTFTFPMVVGPRYNPPFKTDGVGAVARGKAGASGQATEVQYLRPTERSGHDISLSVNLDAGVPIESIESKSHVVQVDRDPADKSTAQVILSEHDAIPNKDFVLRYTVAGKTVKSAMLVHPNENDEAGGYFTLMLYPPANLADAQRGPMELVFVLDCSGSMKGEPIRLAKQAVERVLKQLRPDDTFQIIRFSNDASQLGPAPIPATKANVQSGLDYLASLNGSGGTQMIEGIKAALDFPHDDNRLRFVCFLTDGFIGNESDILAAVHDKLDASRIFSVGMGSSPNRLLLERMAKMGRGAVAYVGLQDSATEIMDAFFSRVSAAALTDLSIDWAGMQVADVYPRRLPDLFVGRPVVITGRYEGSPPASIVVQGTSAGRLDRFVVETTGTGIVEEHPALPFVWARMKIADLMDRSTWDRNVEITDVVRETALEYGLMSAYTAFVAVDSLTRTTAGEGTTVPVAVPVPEGVQYETTVQEDG